MLTFSTSCRPTTVVAIAPACADVVNSELILEANYLGFCNSLFEGGQQPMKVEISVDGITYDAQKKVVTLSYMQSFNFNRFNLDGVTDSNLRTFAIQLPRCGSYAVTVVVRGSDVSCFKCCNGSFSPINGNLACPGASGGPQKGTMRFRAISPTINSNATNMPPPLNVTVRPLAEKCSNCGC